MHRGTPAHDRAVDAVGWQTRLGSKRGFTLVELLVVLVIIGMLASMVSFAMFRSMQAAREAKTQALISKLHNVIARHWDTFETGQPPSVGEPPTQMTVTEWMKDEMPCNKNEFEQSNTLILLFDRNGNESIAGDTYTDENGNEIPESPINDDVATQHAQCLYQIVLLLADDDLDRINLFSENETKDLDGDGTPDCFIDGWRQPIGFIRKPTGFREWRENDSDPDSNILIPNPSDINDKDATNSNGGTGIYFPLIYSNGPDTTAGIDGTGTPESPGGAHADNIHNHRMNARLQ